MALRVKMKKMKYVATILDKEGIKLNLENISYNQGRRQMCKILLNSFWGKFGQQENLTQIDFINGDINRFNELLFTDKLYEVNTLVF